MNRTLPNLSKLLSPWSPAAQYQSRVTAAVASNDEHFDLRDQPSAPASGKAPVRLTARQRVLLNGAIGEPRYIDGSMLVRRRDS